MKRQLTKILTFLTAFSNFKIYKISSLVLSFFESYQFFLPYFIRFLIILNCKFVNANLFILLIYRVKDGIVKIEIEATFESRIEK